MIWRRCPAERKSIPPGVSVENLRHPRCPLMALHLIHFLQLIRSTRAVCLGSMVLAASSMNQNSPMTSPTSRAQCVPRGSIDVVADETRGFVTPHNLNTIDVHAACRLQTLHTFQRFTCYGTEKCDQSFGKSFWPSRFCYRSVVSDRSGKCKA